MYRIFTVMVALLVAQALNIAPHRHQHQHQQQQQQLKRQRELSEIESLTVWREIVCTLQDASTLEPVPFPLPSPGATPTASSLSSSHKGMQSNNNKHARSLLTKLKNLPSVVVGGAGNGNSGEVLSLLLAKLRACELTHEEANHVATKAFGAFAARGAGETCFEWLRALESESDTSTLPDIVTYTSAMTALINHQQQHHLAIEVFENLQERRREGEGRKRGRSGQQIMHTRLALDTTIYIEAIKAASRARSNEYVLRLLQDAVGDLGQEEAIHVAHAALTNLKYKEELPTSALLSYSSSSSSSSSSAVEEEEEEEEEGDDDKEGREEEEEETHMAFAYKIASFIDTQLVTTKTTNRGGCTQTMDILLAVAAVKGCDRDMLQILRKYLVSSSPEGGNKLALRPSVFTFNTLLSRCCFSTSSSSSSSTSTPILFPPPPPSIPLHICAALFTCAKKLHTPTHRHVDDVTYNTLLSYCANKAISLANTAAISSPSSSQPTSPVAPYTLMREDEAGEQAETRRENLSDVMAFVDELLSDLHDTQIHTNTRLGMETRAVLMRMYAATYTHTQKHGHAARRLLDDFWLQMEEEANGTRGASRWSARESKSVCVFLTCAIQTFTHTHDFAGAIEVLKKAHTFEHTQSLMDEQMYVAVAKVCAAAEQYTQAHKVLQLLFESAKRKQEVCASFSNFFFFGSALTLHSSSSHTHTHTHTHTCRA